MFQTGKKKRIALTLTATPGPPHHDHRPKRQRGLGGGRDGAHREAERGRGEALQGDDGEEAREPPPLRIEARERVGGGAEHEGEERGDGELGSELGEEVGGDVVRALGALARDDRALLGEHLGEEKGNKKRHVSYTGPDIDRQ
jgi:hypothetical protein